jgi:REP element-mobilizing transposase RayT
MAIVEKPHRLPPAMYQGTVRATFSIRLGNNDAFFTTRERVDPFIQILAEARTRHNCRNWVFIFMPDHMHFVNEGTSPASDLLKMIYFFKQKTGYWLSRNTDGVAWQKDFYDHIHRQEDDLPKHIRYILENPVRKGLVTQWRDYPFAGSLDHPMDGLI